MMNLLEGWLPSWRRRKHLLIVAFSIVAVTILATYFLKSQTNFFEGFSKFFLGEAQAEDIFELKAEDADSLGVGTTSSYLLTSKHSVELEELRKKIVLEPAVSFSIEEKGKRQWAIRLAEPLNPNTVLKVALDAAELGFIDERGAREYTWAFQVRDSFKVLHTLPRDTGTNVPLNSGVEVTLSYDNFLNYEEYFSIVPKANGRLEKHGRTLVFVPDAFAPQTVYTVTIKKGLPAEGSEVSLSDDYVFAFETQSDPGAFSGSRPWLSAYQKTLDVGTSEAPLVQLYASGLKEKTISVSLYRLDGEEEYLKILASRNQLPWWASSRDRYAIDTASRARYASFQVELQEEESLQYLRFPNALPSGYYVADLKTNGVATQVWLQITDLAAYVNVAKNKTLVWVTDVGSKNLVASARIKLLDGSDTFFTDSQGVSSFATPVALLGDRTTHTSTGTEHFRITANDRVLIIPAMSSYGNQDPASDYWTYLYTDRPLYQPSDTIKFWGLLRHRAKATIQEPLSIVLVKDGYIDYSYQPVTIEKKDITLNQIGTYAGDITTRNLRPDSYTVELRVGDDVVARRYIQVKPYDKPAYELRLVPDRKNAMAGETIHLKGQASFFEGTPVPNLALLFHTPEGEQRVVTNADGTVELDYTVQYKPCSSQYSCWPRSAWLELRPELSELADITTSAHLTFYGPNVWAGTTVSYPEAGKGQLKVQVNAVDLSAVNPQTDRPVGGTKIESDVVKIIYDKREIGTGYDFINKLTYKRYAYSRREEVIGHISGTANEAGVYLHEMAVEPETSYRLDLNIFDLNGRSNNTQAYLYYYDGRKLGTSQSDGNFYRLKLPEDNSFSIGERVTVGYVNNDEPLPPGENNYYLFAQYQNGLQEYAVSRQSSYEFPFEERDIPNVNLWAVYFNGSAFVVTEPGWEGNAIRFDTVDRNLRISVRPHKEKYVPGETVRLAISTQDSAGRPVGADVNLNLVDEALYAVIDEYADPIPTIYRAVDSASLFSYSSHERPTNPYAGAEKGGCFLEGTLILMADGSKKPIQDIVPGDKVLTFADPISRTTSAGEVTATFHHVVSEYLTINDQLNVTPEHLVYANHGFRPAGTLKVGDWMIDHEGKEIAVVTLERHREVVPVYNLRIDPQHTYFADGFFVHNDKGGASRDFFTDAALFQSVRTNSAGQAVTTFTLPDNITSWRVTAQGISANLDVGVSTSKLPVSLPVFAEVTMAKEYLVGEQPAARLRAFGSALASADDVAWKLTAQTLGIEKTASAKAFASTFMHLPVLSLGNHLLTYALTSTKGNDALSLPLSVISSRLSMEVVETTPVATGYEAKASDQPLTIVLSDPKRATLYRTLNDLSWPWGSRIDQAYARKASRDLLQTIFGIEYEATNFVGSQYQAQGGGLTLLPYSGEEVELSARMVGVGAESFDQVALQQFFLKKTEAADSTREEVSASLYGLAALKQPVLPRVQAWMQRDDLSPKEQLYGALALIELGDGEQARQVYRQLLDKYGWHKEPHIILRTSEAFDDVLFNTALAAHVAAALNAPEFYGFESYLESYESSGKFTHRSDIVLSLEKLGYAQSTAKHLPVIPTTATIEVNGERRRIELSPDHQQHEVILSPNQSLTVTDVKGDLFAAIHRSVPLVGSNLSRDTDIEIRREYYVGGQRMNNFQEDDLVEVRLYPSFSNDALNGYYQITDTLPSGLAQVTRLYSGNSYDCHYWYPYHQDGQQTKFMISKDWRSQYCGGDYFRYFARVKTKGTYRAEPAVMQSMVNPDFLNYQLSSESITIN